MKKLKKNKSQKADDSHHKADCRLRAAAAAVEMATCKHVYASKLAA